MQRCVSCNFWKKDKSKHKEGVCINEKSSYYNDRCGERNICCRWEGKQEDRNYNLEQINEALKPLGVTFEELFSLRHFEVSLIEIEIQRHTANLQYSRDLSYEQINMIMKDQKELEQMRERIVNYRKEKTND